MPLAQTATGVHMLLKMCDDYATENYIVSQKKGPTLKRYSSKLYGSILMIFGGNIQKSLE